MGISAANKKIEIKVAIKLVVEFDLVVRRLVGQGGSLSG